MLPKMDPTLSLTNNLLPERQQHLLPLNIIAWLPRNLIRNLSFQTSRYRIRIPPPHIMRQPLLCMLLQHTLPLICSPEISPLLIPHHWPPQPDLQQNNPEGIDVM